MKKSILFLFLPFLFLIACQKEKDISVNDLPATSNSFIAAHFGGLKVTKVVKDFDNLKVTYEVYLSDGTKLEFDKNGVIIEMERNSALPESTLPAALVQYVKDNYPDQSIFRWEKESNGQEIKLSNGVELKFDLNGNFLRVDV